jgi:hypothetical protein
VAVSFFRWRKQNVELRVIIIRRGSSQLKMFKFEMLSFEKECIKFIECRVNFILSYTGQHLTCTYTCTKNVINDNVTGLKNNEKKVILF